MGLFGSISHTLRHTARVAERQVVRHPPQRRKIPVRTQRQVSRVVSGAVNTAARAAVASRHPRPRPSRVGDVLPGVRAVTHPSKARPARHEYRPIVSPFSSASMRGEPFRLGQDIAHSKALEAVRNSYTLPTAMREYRRFMEATFKKAGRQYPGAGRRMPQTDFALPGYLHAETTQLARGRHVLPPRRRSVHFTPDNAWAYVLNGRGDTSGDFARFAPLHEWAHVFQRSPAVRKYGPSGLSHALIEGGAQAFAQQLAPRLGLPAQSRASNPGYASLANYVRRTKGRRYIQRGQFGY